MAGPNRDSESSALPLPSSAGPFLLAMPTACGAVRLGQTGFLALRFPPCQM